MVAGVAGLSPGEWEARLEAAASDPQELASVLAELSEEMSRESTWLHENPDPGRLLTAVLEFFGGEERDQAALSEQLRQEIRLEQYLKERYRSWLPGEEVSDLLFPYLKGFGEPVRLEEGGLQFPGFLKLAGFSSGSVAEAWTFYVSERFPGRDPANFHILFRSESGELVIKRVYKKELPRIEGITTVGRGVLAEMIKELVPSLAEIREVEIDNAANRATREALLISTAEGERSRFTLRPGADPLRTPLGHLMHQLSLELGFLPGGMQLFVGPFGTLRMELPLQR